METVLVKTGEITKDEFSLEEYGVDHNDFSVFAIVFGEKDGRTEFALGLGSNLDEANRVAIHILEQRL